MIGRNRMGNILQQNGLAGARRRHDQSALALAERRHDIDHPRRKILPRRIRDFHFQTLVRIERRQIVKMNLVPLVFRVFKIDGVDLDQRKVALAILGTADLALNRIAGPQREFPDLAWAHINIVGPGQVIGIRRAQEAKAILQDLDDALADNFDVAHRQVLENGKHQLLLAQRAGIFHFQFFGQRHQLGRGLLLKILKLNIFQFSDICHVLISVQLG